MNERKRLLRSVVLDILLGQEEGTYPANQIPNLKTTVAEVLKRRTPSQEEVFAPFPHQPRLSYDDDALVQEIFWDLVIEKVLTIGMDATNASLPWFPPPLRGSREP